MISLSIKQEYQTTKKEVQAMSTFTKTSLFDCTITKNSINVVPHFLNVAKTDEEKFEGFVKFLEDTDLLKNDSPIQKKIGSVLAETIRTISGLHMPFDTIYRMFSSVQGIEKFLSMQSREVRRLVFRELDRLMKKHRDDVWYFLD